MAGVAIEKTAKAKGSSSLNWNMWTTITMVVFVIYLTFLVYPILTVLSKAVFVDGSFTLSSFTEFFSNEYYSQTLLNSVVVSSLGTLLSLLLGSVMGYLFAMFDFRGKPLLQILIVVASMSPPFVGAYSWILLLGRSGVITTFFVNVLHLPQINIYGIPGIVLVFTLQLFPLVFMYVSGALKKVDSSVLEAAASMGCTGVKRFFSVLLPLMTPTIIASALLVFMKSFADFGTPMLIGEGYRTFPVTIYQEFISEVGGNDTFAAALAIIAIVIAMLLFFIQQAIANKFSFTMNSLHPIEPAPVHGWKKIPLLGFVYFIIAMAILPQGYLVYTSFLKTSGMIFVPGYSFNSYIQVFTRPGFTTAIFNTLRIPLIALVIVLLIGVTLAYVAVRHRNILTKLTDTLGMMPYIIPGTVLGIAFITAFNSGIGRSGFLAITGTVTIMAVSFAMRRLPFTVRSSEAILRQIPITIEEAAESLGSSRFNTFLKITVPMMASGIVSGAILTWITMITELSTSILLYTVKTKTMTVAIYTEVLRGNYGIAAALSTILILFTVLSLILFMKVSGSKDITMS